MKLHVLVLSLVALPALAHTSQDPVGGTDAPSRPVRSAPGKPLDEALAKALQAKLDELVDTLQLPGATAAVVFADGREGAFGAGQRDLDAEDDGMPPNARMLAGSTGKTFFAAAAVSLQIEGKVDLDDRLTTLFADDEGRAPEWLGQVPNAKDVTLRDLLQHRSGIPEYVWDPKVAEEVSADPDRVWGHGELARLLVGRERLGDPRDEFAYADANYVLAMHAIEHATGVDLYDVAKARVLDPLGLAATRASDGRDLGELAQGHVVLGARLGAPKRMLDGDGRLTFNTQFEWAGGGYVSSSADLARFARWFWSGELFDGEYLADLLDAHPTPRGPGNAYGIGTIVHETDLGPAHGHDGFFPGYMTSVAWFPDRGFAVAVQTNTDDMRKLRGTVFRKLLMPVASAVETD